MIIYVVFDSDGSESELSITEKSLSIPEKESMTFISYNGKGMSKHLRRTKNPYPFDKVRKTRGLGTRHGGKVPRPYSPDRKP